MFRTASRAILPPLYRSAPTPRTIASRRFLTTAPPHHRSRSWRNTLARWGIVISGIYYYNTSELFAEQPPEYRLDPKADHDDGVNIPTLEELSQSSSQRKSIPQQSSRPASADPSEDNKHLVTVPQEHASAAPSADKPLPLDDQAADSSATPLSSSSPDPSTLEEEADGEGAFNPATGEINWDCPCLGGMAHGPCGEEFRAAFSCFVFSQEEPKGMDCIEKFKGMQECFRAHPDVYAAELADNDNEELDEALETERKGLIRDIQERGKESGSEQEESSHKRLLEVDPPKERKPILRTGDSTISSPGPSSLSSDPTSHPAITPKTSEVSSEPRGPTTEKSDTSRRI